MFECSHIGGAAANVHNGGADFLFVIDQAGKPRRVGGKGFFGDFQVGVFNYGRKVFKLDVRHHAEQNVDRKVFTVDVAGVFDFLAEVETIVGGQAVNQFIVFNVDFIDAFFDDFFYVEVVYRTVAVDGNRGPFQAAFNPVAGDVDNDAVNAFIRHLFCRFDRIANGKGRLVDVRDDSVFYAFGGVVTVADNIDFFITANLGNQTADFG